MTEFEAAPRASQKARRALMTCQTVLRARMGAVSSGLVLYGFRRGRRGTEQRRAEARQQHQETMPALGPAGRSLMPAGEGVRDVDRTDGPTMMRLRAGCLGIVLSLGVLAAALDSTGPSFAQSVRKSLSTSRMESE